jgi:hypothetical protein
MAVFSIQSTGFGLQLLGARSNAWARPVSIFETSLSSEKNWEFRPSDSRPIFYAT